MRTPSEKSRMAPLSVDGKTFVQELGKLHKQLADLIGVEADDRVIGHRVGLLEGDVAALVHEDFKSVSPGNVESVAARIIDVDSHELTLRLCFSGGKLKTAELADGGKTVWVGLAGIPEPVEAKAVETKAPAEPNASGQNPPCSHCGKVSKWGYYRIRGKAFCEGCGEFLLEIIGLGEPSGHDESRPQG